MGVTSRVLHYRHPDLLAAAAAADVVVCYRVPATVQVLETIEALHGAGIPLVFDVDDLIFDPGEADEIPALRILPPDEAALWLNGVERYRTTLEACDAFVGSTALLVERAAAVTELPGPPVRQRRRVRAGPGGRPRAAPTSAPRSVAPRVLQRHDDPRRGLVPHRGGGERGPRSP